MNLAASNKYIALVAPYSITVSTLYLFGYWGSFGVNIFEYVGLAEIAKIALYQLMYYGAFVLLGSLISEMFFGSIIRRVMPPGSGADLPEAKFVRILFRLVHLAMVGFALYIALFTESEMRWILAGAFISPVVSIAVDRSGFLLEVLPDSAARNAIIYPSVIILLLAYGFGAVGAIAVKTKEDKVLVNQTLPEKGYIGRTSSHVFFWKKDSKAVEILPETSVTSLKFVVPAERPPFGADLRRVLTR